MEIIHLVEGSDLPVKMTLRPLDCRKRRCSWRHRPG